VLIELEKLKMLSVAFTEAIQAGEQVQEVK